MCKTFYLEHDTCTCIYIEADFIPCAAYLLAHPEALSEPSNPFADPEDPFADPEDPPSNQGSPLAYPDSVPTAQAAQPKLLIRTHRGLNLTHDGLDFVSVDMDESWAPKGLECPAGTIVAMRGHRVTNEKMVCRLCEDPEALGLFEEMGLVGDNEGQSDELGPWLETGKQKGKGKEKEKEKGSKVARIKMAAVKLFKKAVGGGGKEGEGVNAGYEEIEGGGSLKGKEAEKKKKEAEREKKDMEKNKKKAEKKAESKKERKESKRMREEIMGAWGP